MRLQRLRLHNAAYNFVKSELRKLHILGWSRIAFLHVLKLESYIIKFCGVGIGKL